jgi:hypothetical protein
LSEIKPPFVTFLLFLFSMNFKFELRDNLLEIMTNMTYLSYMSYQPSGLINGKYFLFQNSYEKCLIVGIAQSRESAMRCMSLS